MAITKVSEDLINKTFGTAAELDVGTSANQIVQLDSGAKLPAIDGSQLTSLPSPGVFTNLVEFTSAGSTTWTVPADVEEVEVEVLGGGGGGATYGTPGGSGCYCKARVDNITPSSTISITVGAAGAVGSAGGTSSFGSEVSCTGGSAGNDTPTTANQHVSLPGTVGTVTLGSNATAIMTGGENGQPQPFYEGATNLFYNRFYGGKNPLSGLGYGTGGRAWQGLVTISTGARATNNAATAGEAGIVRIWY